MNAGWDAVSISELFRNVPERNVRNAIVREQCFSESEMMDILLAFREIADLSPSFPAEGILFITFTGAFGNSLPDPPDIRGCAGNGEEKGLSFYDICPRMMLATSSGCSERSISVVRWEMICGACTERRFTESDAMAALFVMSLINEMTFFGFSKDIVDSKLALGGIEENLAPLSAVSSLSANDRIAQAGKRLEIAISPLPPVSGDVFL